MLDLTGKLKKNWDRYRLKNSPFYSEYPSLLPVQISAKHTLVSREHNYVYFRVPKVANSTIVQGLYFASTGEIISSDEGLEHASNTYFHAVDQLDIEEVKALGGGGFRAFTFVRNPYSRFLSFYLQKVVNPKKDRFGIKIKEFIGKRTDDPVTIKDALDFLSFGRNLYTNAHFAPQESLTQIPLEKFDYIGRFETFSRDFDEIYFELFEKIRPSIQITTHATKASSLVSEYLTSQDRNRIYKLYEKDFDLFKYPKLLT